MRTVSKPFFSGQRTTELAQQQHLSARKLRENLSRDNNPYLGSVPAELLPDSGLQDKAWQELDNMVRALRERGLPQKAGFELFKDDQPLTITFIKVGAGDFGVVYNLEAGGKHFALKLFNIPKKILGIPTAGLLSGRRHGAYAEAANGLYANTLDAWDAVPFYCANPIKSWQLLGFETSDPAYQQNSAEPANRRSIQEAGFIFEDDYAPGNRINGKRIDYGGMRKATPLNRLLNKVWAGAYQLIAPFEEKGSG
jgi:hypothetical protein